MEQPETSMVTADIHPTPAITLPSTTQSLTPGSDSTAGSVSTPSSQIAQSLTVSTPSGQLVQSLTPGSDSTSTAGVAGVSTPSGQILQLTAAQIAQLITPGGSAVGGPQQILNIGGQNVLVSGSGPGTIGSSSVRYGKILKGVHKYFCAKCKRPFTQKESLTRHELENCPMLKQKKKHKCETCGLAKFSSKQYLKEHIHEVHLKKFCYFCPGC